MTTNGVLDEIDPGPRGAKSAASGVSVGHIFNAHLIGSGRFVSGLDDRRTGLFEGFRAKPAPRHLEQSAANALELLSSYTQASLERAGRARVRREQINAGNGLRNIQTGFGSEKVDSHDYFAGTPVTVTFLRLASASPCSTVLPAARA
ncbi:MAG: hypothetical protein DDT20_00675 [Firmicutes bacterium]|nr:hypothetical protein [Bacillota bacterium]